MSTRKGSHWLVRATALMLLLADPPKLLLRTKPTMELWCLPLHLPILLPVVLIGACHSGGSLVVMSVEWWLTLSLVSPETLVAFVLALTVVRSSPKLKAWSTIRLLNMRVRMFIFFTPPSNFHYSYNTSTSIVFSKKFMIFFF